VLLLGQHARMRSLRKASSRASAVAGNLGTHQGAASAEHLEAYINEFTFRFNRRHSRRRGMLFYRLLEQSIAADPITYSRPDRLRARDRPTLHLAITTRARRPGPGRLPPVEAKPQRARGHLMLESRNA
jgi:hypothetical protein